MPTIHIDRCEAADMSKPTDPTAEDPTFRMPPPGWDPDDGWEPSNNDAMNYEGTVDVNGFPDPDDFYDP